MAYMLHTLFWSQ